ncbi:glycosyltransferase family 4 protein [Zhihengliuella sp.]|uniref:glycosyltransferase family 4 protein n=1 Tax=Zhihengliuella sp. TaxID=1954483 RepID=UPI002810B65B|nr:glycosyltransferase family 4 protein [Zhihengliuella sp.]
MTPRLPGPIRRNGRQLAGAVGRAARRLPGPVKNVGREAFELMPDTEMKRRLDRALRGASAGRRTRPGDTAFSDAHVPLVHRGSTYSAGEVSTYLQLEAAHLRRRLFAEQTLAQAAEGPAGADPEQDAAVRELVDEYVELAGTEDDADGGTHLVIVNVYPSVGNEYGNGFVHRRIKYYLEAGAQVHVVVVGPETEPSAYTYDGVAVITGDGAEARELLRRRSYRSVSAHFMGRYIWDQIKHDLTGQTFYCFMHGFESRRWIRTLYNYRTPDQVDAAIADTVDRQGLWREVLAHPWGPVKFVFVSDWWRRASQEDMELVYPASRSEVVHNVIETKLFRYVPKPAAQRFKLLWIRSASNLNYGSDIAVEVLTRLRETDYWDSIEARIIGDGRHFGAFESAFEDDDNVTVERRYASQDEIALLHREYGVFLVPSRLDSQGVSRDEAMASGLVPVTNTVSAIPEFVDDSCAVLAPGEDADAMIAGLIRLFEDPERFLRMSAAAAERVARQSGPEATIGKELRLLGVTGRERGDAPGTPASEGSQS